MNRYKKYRELLSNVYNALAYREPIEWTNTWFDNANTISLKRYLIIGDSTARMIRSSFAKELKCPVDMIGCSSGLDDEIFVSTIDAFFNNNPYNYDAIFINIGYHSRTNKYGNCYNEEDYYKFKEDYIALLTFLSQHTNKIIAESIFDAIIPHKYPQIKNLLIRIGIHRFTYLFGLIKEVPDNEINKVTHHKNQIIKEIIKHLPPKLSNKCQYYDINFTMNNSHYLHIDHIHFEEKAKSYIAHQMSRILDSANID